MAGGIYNHETDRAEGLPCFAAQPADLMNRVNDVKSMSTGKEPTQKRWSTGMKSLLRETPTTQESFSEQRVTIATPSDNMLLKTVRLPSSSRVSQVSRNYLMLSPREVSPDMD